MDGHHRRGVGERQMWWRRRREQQKTDKDDAIPVQSGKKVGKGMHVTSTGKKRKRSRGSNEGGSQDTAVIPSVVARGANHSLDPTTFPLPFPSRLDVPPRGLLRDEDPYQESFRTALNTSYQGFATDIVADDDDNDDVFEHSNIRQALKRMEAAGLFRTDVTQPFGLGTKCAKTYVTRCLLGDHGTTYKYLGLRMFAHSWDSKGSTNQKTAKTKKRKKEQEKKDAEERGPQETVGMTLPNAVHTMARLNDRLTDRTKVHLQELAKARGGNGVLRGRGDRPKFDVALINRMEYSKDLKKEPQTGEGRCSVSWHADSCLEHYSTIAVYHSLSSNHKDPTGHKTKTSKSSGDNNWSVALRVAHHSEGPGASRRGTDISSSVITEMPPIAVSLPSGSAYYLLEDFNHHHQHAVLSSSKKPHDTIRFSSTHRLLREGHNVSFVLERCRVACSNFHRKGPKIWRSEQLLLTEVESEWLRQFYIQGSGHKDNLWQFWKEPIESLWKYWSQLEERTKSVVELFRAAAEEKCGGTISFALPGHNNPPRARKVREKRRKAALSLEEILGRSVNGTSEKKEDEDVLFEPFAQLLEERANLRHLWEEREQDNVFQRMESDYKPIKFPARFGVSTPFDKSKEAGPLETNDNDISASSPLGGSPLLLRRLASHVRDWGKSFWCGVAHGDYTEDAPAEGATTTTSKSDSIMAKENEAHTKSISWEGWSSPNRLFGLEMQQPWSRMLLEGSKTTEVRAYPLPNALLKRRILLLESQAGEAGVSSVPNVVHWNDASRENTAARVIGWCTFDNVRIYKNKAEFDADVKSHRVKEGSGYEWKDGQKSHLYGWTVGSRGQFPFSKGESNGANNETLPQPSSLHRMERRMRSLFELYGSDPPRSPDPLQGLAKPVMKASSDCVGKKRRQRKKKRKTLPDPTRGVEAKKKKRY